MRVNVYLNEGPNHFFGFDPETACLNLSLAFDMENANHYSILNLVYEQLNVGGEIVPATEWTKQYRANRCRSLSMGDVVVVGETAYACADVGWDRITTEELERASARQLGGSNG